MVSRSSSDSDNDLDLDGEDFFVFNPFFVIFEDFLFVDCFPSFDPGGPVTPSGTCF